MLEHTVDSNGSWYFCSGGEEDDDHPVHITRILQNVGTVMIDYDDDGNVIGVEVLTSSEVLD